MRAGNIIAIILGVLVVIGGIWCLMTPLQTIMGMAWLIGFMMIVDGIANIATWFQLRKIGAASGWALASAIISVILGIVVVGNFFMQAFLAEFLTYLTAAWLIVSGIMRIGYGWSMRSLHKNVQASMVGGRWYVVFALGILLLVFGIMSLISPVVLAEMIGMFIGISIIVLGVSMISLAL
jgi:uncharacterized membrane protein HdeD (DUF308 family)